MKIRYRDIGFSGDSLQRIEQANAIIDTYRAQGYDLTLRQVYYQFVARGLIANRQTEYDNLGALLAKARYAGLVDWEAISDRTRALRDLAHWDEPADIVKAAASQYLIDKWAGQGNRVEVWVEKDALIGVIEQVAQELDVPCFSCRGYVSLSEMWAAARRHIAHWRDGKSVTVLHLGDHDPSGIDMSRDIEGRLTEFCEHHGSPPPIVERIALNMAQVRQYNPPPNPAKLSDSRAAGYVAAHGHDSWELDALEPGVIAALVRRHVLALRDEDVWGEAVEIERGQRLTLAEAAGDWDGVVEHLMTRR